MSRPRTRLTRQIENVAGALHKSPVTIRAWVSQGLDVFNPDEIVRWYQFKESRRRNRRSPSSNGVSGRRIRTPADGGEKVELNTALNGHRQDSVGMLNMEILEKLPPPSGEGAAAALRRLQGLESIFYSRQLEALAKGHNDLISYSLTDYRRITETLLDYERQVELAMRDSGQLIPRGDAERGAGAVARWFRLGWRLWLSSCTPDLLQFAGDPRMFKSKAEESFGEIMKTVFTKAREAKIELPAWALLAVREESRSVIPDDPVPLSGNPVS
jgi:hypothetical protein